jgi:uncharacterized membrane-anchored protein YjiN (DUF445 family)
MTVRDTTLDAERRRGLRRMKAVATGALLVAAVVYVATIGETGVLGFVNAAAEASMVGAIADWFAVTALFRHPLGLPVPHTAIIPERKDALGRSLQEFVAGNFLTEPVIRAQLAKAHVANRVGAWLAEPEHAERVGGELATMTRATLRVLRDEDVAALLEELVVRQVATQAWSPPTGRLLARIVADGSHHRLVDLAVEHVHTWLSQHRETVIRVVMEQAPTWSPTWVDERVARHVYEVVLRFVGDVRDDPRHMVRRALDDAISVLAHNLQERPQTRERFERFVQVVLEREDVRAAVGGFWITIRKVLSEAVDDPGSTLRRRMASGLAAVGRRLRDDPELAARVDAYVEDAVSYLVSTYRGEVATVISDTVQRWDGAEASRLIELHVGRDLQFIRINGTVIGGLVGLAIHTVTVLAS